MRKLLPLLAASLVFAAPAEAHRRHGHHQPRFWVSWRAPHVLYPIRHRQPRIRVSQNCVYKPVQDKLICRY